MNPERCRVLIRETQVTAKTKKAGRPAKANITESDFNDWQQGKVQLAELASRCGVSVAAVSKAMKKHRPLASPAPLLEDSPTIAPSRAGVGPGDRMLVQPIWQQGPDGFQGDDVMTLARSAAYGALLQAHRVLASQADVGPTQLKVCAGVVQWSIDQLDRLGVISLDKMEHEQLPKLRIEVMTEEEEESLRRGNHFTGEVQVKAAA